MRKLFALSIITVFLFTQAQAQGRGRGASSGGRMGGGGMSTSMGAGNQSRVQQQTMQHDRQRIQATAQQRDRYHDCLSSSSQLRKQARQMKQVANKNQLNSQNRVQMREQLRTQLQQMSQEHEQLMNGLSEEQKTGAKNAIEKVNAKKNEVNAFAEALDLELQQEEMNREQVKTEAQNLERSVVQLQENYRAMNNEIDME